MRNQRAWRIALAGLLLCVSSGLAQDKKPAPVREGGPYLGVIASPDATMGVLVREVAPDSPADKAGLRAGDLIIKLDDREVKDYEALATAVAGRKAGDKLTLHVRRDGKEEKRTVTLSERPALARRPVLVRPPFERPRMLLGVQTQELTPELKQQLGAAVDKGVVITDVVPGSAADKAGLKASDIITAVGDTEVASHEQLREAVQNAGAGKEVSLKVARGKETVEVKAKLEEIVGGPAAPPFPLPRIAPRPEGRFPVEVPPIFEEGRRVQDLEKRIQELEKRVRDLEQRQPRGSEPKGPESKPTLPPE